MDEWYPMTVRLTGRKCLVAGGGKVAERRIGGLLSCGAEVTIISPKVTGVIRKWGEQGKLAIRLREYRSEDMTGNFLAVAATDRLDVNDRIAEDARSAGTLVNRADDQETCDFIVPSAVRRGKLLMTVTTSGASPSLAAAIRRDLQDQYGGEYAELLDLLHEVRLKLKESVHDPEQRRLLLGALPFEELLDAVRAGELDACRRELLEWAGSHPDSPISSFPPFRYM